MKNIKRILAIIGCIFLVGLYVTTFVSSIIDNSNTMVLFRTSIYATVIIPTLIYAYVFIYKLIKKYYGKDRDE